MDSMPFLKISECCLLATECCRHKDRKDAVKANPVLRADNRSFCIYSLAPFSSGTCKTPVNLFG